MTVTEPTVDPATVAEMRALVARLELLLVGGELSAAPFAAVNPDGSPGAVAAGELIESAWGNAVATWLNRRTGCALRASQSIGTGATGVLAWTTEDYDTDNFHATSSTDIVIPANLGGIYNMFVSLDAGGTLNGASTLQINASSLPIMPSYIPAANRYGVASATILATPGAVLSASVFNGHSGAATFSGRLWLQRISK